MLIICEVCHAIYSVAKKNIGPTGRAVKCAKCNHVWMVQIDQGPELPLEPCTTLPVLFKPALPKSFIAMPILLILIIILINFIFFPEFFIRLQPFRNIYEKCGIYDSKGLLLENFTFKFEDNELQVKGEIINNSDEEKIVPAIRYILRDKDKEINFRFTQQPAYQIIKPKESWPINSKIININENAAYFELDIGNKLEFLLK